MFWMVFPSIIWSSRLYTEHQVYVIQVSWLLAGGHEMERHIPDAVLNSWWWMEEWYSVNSKIVHLVGFTIEVKQSLFRPEQALRVPGGQGSKVSRHSAPEGCQIVSRMHWPPLPPQAIFLVLISFRGRVDLRAVVQPEGLSHWKIPVTPSGIKLATFWLVAQCLNQVPGTTA